MAAPLFIGDEVTAAGFRQAGLDIETPALGDVARTFSEALKRSPMLVISAAYAAALPPGALDAAVRNAEPLIVIVDDAARPNSTPDAAAEINRVLGIES